MMAKITDKKAEFFTEKELPQLNGAFIQFLEWAKADSFWAAREKSERQRAAEFKAEILKEQEKTIRLIEECETRAKEELHIAQPDHIKALQEGLENAVAQGIFKKAGNYQTKVSACGRTFETNGNHRRMELCGYFPSENPLYTIMVVLEKDGLPASAGGMCGLIFSNTVDVLVDLYGLQSAIVQNYDDSDDLIEIVDTVAVQ